MSKFSYDKVGQYGTEVVARIEKNKGDIKAIDKKIYGIDTSAKSVFGRFAKHVKDNKFDKAEAVVRKEQFEVLTPVDRPKKFITLGWTQIEKSVFSSPNIKISTEEQEKITLLIIKNVLGNDTKTWKDFDEMFHAKNSEINKIFPDLTKLPSWWNHFELQFKKIKTTAKLQNDSYDVYLYDGAGSFMDYISDLVTVDLNLYSKKDSWNPADIWLVKSKPIQQKYMEDFDQIKVNLDEGKVYGKDSMKAIKEINKILKTAYGRRHIVGLSLKKSNQKQLKFNEFNLQAKFSQQKLPDVKFNKISLDCRYSDVLGFSSKTSYVHVNDGSRGAFKLAFKSNTGLGVGNITYEFLPDGAASAFLGKVPKDQLKKWLIDQITTRKNGISTQTQMPQGNLLSTEWNEEEKELWTSKVAIIKRHFGNFAGLDDFVENLEKSYIKFGLTEVNSSMMQMVDFTYILAKLEENKNLTKFVSLCYYFAQKKGQIYNFGPFGKVY